MAPASRVTLTRDRQISGIFAGDPVKAHAAGVRFVQETCLEQIDEPADLVVTSSAGFPLDLTFYQSVKAATAAQHLVKRGGRIFVVAECSEGMVSREFATSLKKIRSFEAYLAEIASPPVKPLAVMKRFYLHRFTKLIYCLRCRLGFEGTLKA